MIAVSEEMKKEDLKDPSNMEQEVSEESASENTEASAEEDVYKRQVLIRIGPPNAAFAKEIGTVE